MILITGATGTIGRAVLGQLVPTDEPIRALTRDPSRVTDADGVQTIAGDFDDHETLQRAMEGVRAAFLLNPGGPAGERADAALVRAAQQAGVEKLVKLSSIGTGTPLVAGADWHAVGEQLVRDSGLTWAIVRPSAYASNALRWADAIRAGQAVPNLTGAATQGIVDPRDVAGVIVQALTSSDHDGRTYTLTGPELLSTADQVAQLGRLLGRTLTTVDVPLAAARQGMIEMGIEAEHADAMVRGLEIIGAGHNAVVTNDIPELLRRPATTFETWASDNLMSFQE